AAGTLALAKSALVFPQPFLPIFLAVFGAALWRAVLRAPAPPPAADGEAPAVTPGFLGALIALTLGLHWLLVPTLGAVTFTERWMHPALMVLPVFLFALVERGRPGPRAIAVYLAVVAVFVAAALGARVVRYGLGADHCGKCRELVPFDRLAAQLRAAGFERGTIVADGFHVGGNLRVAFPDSRVIDPAYPPEVWPEASGAGDGGQCLAAWWADDGHADALKARIDAYLTGVLGVAPDALHVTGRAEAPMRGSTTRSYTLAYELFPRGAGECR
ncbi:MAG TPA: hypothetical protein VFG47_22085, partial [Geminicoccaceae bacterium]|nr:hypothetical protein [Geminicoccaceae bacterium]